MGNGGVAAASAAATPIAPALECRNVTVTFGDLRAVDDVSVAFEPARLHTLVGQNGAGKTTLARVIAGLIKADAGQVMAGGRALPAGDARASRAAGIEMVHQAFTLPPSFTVAEALELFSTRRAPSVYRMSRLGAHWRDELRASGVNVDVQARIRDLPIEALQAIEITRALAADARVLILDEPTAVLPPPAVDRLFNRLRGLRNRGVTVIIVLHKLREVAAIADTVNVLRDGRLVLSPSGGPMPSAGELSDLIVGAGRTETITPISTVEAAVDVARGDETLLEMRGVSTDQTGTEAGLTDVSLSVKSGEIVGVAGVEGNGQRAVVTVVTGLTPVSKGSILFGNAEITQLSSARRRAAGVRVVPFDRNLQGVSQSSALWENVAILPVVTGQPGATRFLRMGHLRRLAKSSLDEWRVRYRTINQRAGELSGGNVQRLILARELSAGVRLLIAAQPTRGLDIAATSFVRTTLKELRDSRGGVVLISSDLDELFELSDRIVVMLSGTTVAEFRRPYDLRTIGDAMVGAARRKTA